MMTNTLIATNKTQAQCLLESAADGDEFNVSFLLRAGANPNAQDQESNTPLMLAAQNGHTKVVTALLRAGANAQNQHGLTALILAARHGHTKIITSLLDRIFPNNSTMLNSHHFVFDTNNSRGTLGQRLLPHIVHNSLLAHVIRALPSRVTSLDLGDGDLDSMGGEALAPAFRAIPDTVTSLDLKGNQLGSLSGGEVLAQAFRAIPRNVTSLDLGYNNLGNLGGEALARALSAIPPHVTSLDLGGNNLRSLGSEALAQVLSAIPSGVTSLDLSCGDLGSLGGEALTNALRAIPDNVTSLDLMDNNLGSLGGEALAQVLGAIPAHVNSLDLGFNELGRMDVNDLVLALSSLSIGVHRLVLEDALGVHMDGEDIARAFRAIPTTVTSLVLPENYFGRLGEDDLTTVITDIPAGVTSLDMSNGLFAEGLEDGQSLVHLGNAINVLPAHVTSLHLGSIDLNACYLSYFIRNIPSSVSVLTLRNNHSKITKNIIRDIPDTVTSLDLANNSFGSMQIHDFIDLIRTVPAHMNLNLNLSNNQLFVNKTRQERDAILRGLRIINPNQNIDLSNNGESDIERAFVPLYGRSSNGWATDCVLGNNDFKTMILRFLVAESSHIKLGAWLIIVTRYMAEEIPRQRSEDEVMENKSMAREDVSGNAMRYNGFFSLSNPNTRVGQETTNDNSKRPITDTDSDENPAKCTRTSLG